MGCNGSKNDVATGNTTTTASHRRLLSRKKSDGSSSGAGSKNLSTIPEADAISVKSTEQSKAQNAVGGGGKDEEKAGVVAEVKEITLNTEKEEEEEGRLGKAEKGGEEEKVASRDSSESYFSSRKEEENVAAVVGDGNEFYSPLIEPTLINGRNEKGVGGAVKTDGQDDQKGVAIGGSDGSNGGNRREASAEVLEEPILVQATTILERVIANKESLAVEEITEEKEIKDSSTKGRP